MHYVIKWIARSIIRGEFWDNEPFWGFIFNNARTERRGEHVIQVPADRAQRGCMRGIFTNPQHGWRAACPCEIGEFEGLECASSDMVV